MPPEGVALRWAARLCVYGSEESDSACPGLAGHGVAVIALPGEHHFGDDYPRLTRVILEHLPANVGHECSKRSNKARSLSTASISPRLSQPLASRASFAPASFTAAARRSRSG